MSELFLNLFCVDASEQCEHAFDWYCETLHKETDVVGLCHIYDTPVIPVPLGGDNMIYDMNLYDSIIKDGMKTSQSILNKFKKKCTERSIKFDVFFQSVEDSIGHSICKIAHEKNAKNIIIGQRGIGVLRRTFLGSVSDYVLHHAHIPTIIIPKKAH